MKIRAKNVQVVINRVHKHLQAIGRRMTYIHISKTNCRQRTVSMVRIAGTNVLYALNGGRCSNTPHPYSCGYTLEDSYRPQISVYLPTTFCVCPSIAMDPQNMCCPNGFNHMCTEGLRDGVPYSRFTAQPLITSIVNERMDRWILRDVLVEPGYQTSYREPADGLQWIPSKNQSGFVQGPFEQVGVFDTHKYYGMAKDICRACPGLLEKVSGHSLRSFKVKKKLKISGGTTLSGLLRENVMALVFVIFIPNSEKLKFTLWEIQNHIFFRSFQQNMFFFWRVI